MCSGFVALLLVVHVWRSSAQMRSDDWICSDRQPIVQYLFTPRDHRLINELALAEDSSSQLSQINYVKLKTEQKRHTDKLNYPSLYMEPPAVNAVSQYVKFPIYTRGKPEIDVIPKNHRPLAITKVKGIPNEIKTSERQQQPARVRDVPPIPIQQTEPQLEESAASKSKAKVKKKPTKKESKERKSFELSPDGDRIEFQIQGHGGPKTYIFGFDTGDGISRQFRLEERLKDGTVKGHYGYYDARGKLRTIKYLARPFDGYREQHHKSNKLSSLEELK